MKKESVYAYSYKGVRHRLRQQGRLPAGQRRTRARRIPEVGAQFRDYPMSLEALNPG